MEGIDIQGSVSHYSVEMDQWSEAGNIHLIVTW